MLKEFKVLFFTENFFWLIIEKMSTCSYNFFLVDHLSSLEQKVDDDAHAVIPAVFNLLFMANCLNSLEFLILDMNLELLYMYVRPKLLMNLHRHFNIISRIHLT